MGKMHAKDVAWDLSSMETSELLSEKTMVFIAKVCLCSTCCVVGDRVCMMSKKGVMRAAPIFLPVFPNRKRSLSPSSVKGGGWNGE